MINTGTGFSLPKPPSGLRIPAPVVIVVDDPSDADLAAAPESESVSVSDVARRAVLVAAAVRIWDSSVASGTSRLFRCASVSAKRDLFCDRL